MPYCSHCLIDCDETEITCRVCGRKLFAGDPGRPGTGTGAPEEVALSGREKLAKLSDYPDLGEALVVQGLLRSLGIFCSVKGGFAEEKIVRMMLGLPVPPSKHPFVGFQVWVLEADLEKCREILDAPPVDDIPQIAPRDD